MVASSGILAYGQSGCEGMRARMSDRDLTDASRSKVTLTLSSASHGHPAIIAVATTQAVNPPPCGRMSPVAVELVQGFPMASQPQKRPVVGVPEPTLVIGSPSTVQDGTYPGLISELERDSANVSEVEKQMVDRILDGGTLLYPPPPNKRDRF